jgi:hypothetical protein
MKHRFFDALMLALALLLASAPLPAHHSFAAEFDSNDAISLQGTITKIEWMNPHVYFYVDVKDANGKVVNWALEGGPPNVLYRQGWRKDTLKPGDGITVDAYRARDNSSTASMRTATMPDGRKVFVGTATDGGPKK